MKQQLPIATGFYVSDSLPVAAQECQNFYVNVPDTANALTKAQCFPTPGLTELFNTGPLEDNRGGWVMRRRPFFVNGNKLYRVDRTISPSGDETLSIVDLGTITGTGRVSMADNGTQLCIVVPGETGYIYNIDTDTLTEITDTAYFDLGPSQKVVYIDGYFVHIADQTIYNSALNDGLSYNGLDFAEAEADPDDIISVHVYKSQLFIGGRNTIEVFQNVGNLNFPFQRISGYIIPIGVSTKESMIEYNGTFAFVGADTGGQPAIYQFSGNGAQKISTTAIETLLRKLSDTEIEAGFAWSYSQDGGIFVGFSFDNATICYDAKASQLSGRPIWHQRQSFGLNNLNRWRVNCILQAYGRFLVGDSEQGIIGEMSLDNLTEYGEALRRVVTSGPFNSDTGSRFWHMAQLLVENGVGNEDDPDPEVRMSYSDDGGRTFSYESVSGMGRGMGQVGDYKIRPTWYRLGYTNTSRIFRFEMSDPVKCVVIGLFAEFTDGR